MIAIAPETTLTQTLALCGYTHRRNARTDITGCHDIFDARGDVVFTGRAGEVWAWLRESGQIEHAARQEEAP